MEPSAEQLVKELLDAGHTLGFFYREWINHYYSGDAPDSPQPYEDAKLVVIAYDAGVVDEVNEKTFVKANNFLHALGKYKDALDTLGAEIAYSYPEQLEGMNRWIEELEGKGDAPENREE